MEVITLKKLYDKYQDYRIYRNARTSVLLAFISFCLSLIIFFVFIGIMIGAPDSYPLSPFTEQPFANVMFYILLLLCPTVLFRFFDKIPNKTKENNKNGFPAHCDIRIIRISLILCMLPPISICVFLPFLVIFQEFYSVWALCCFYIVLPHIPLYVGCYLLGLDERFIKREQVWKEEQKEIRFNRTSTENPSPLSKEQSSPSYNELKVRNRTQILLDRCGFRFFLKYHKQIAVFPLSDVDIVETFSLREKQLRYTYAKRIIDEGLTKTAAEIILSKQSLLTPSELQAAQEILDS